MTIVYKLTDQDMRTYHGCQWAVGEWKETNGKGSLCTGGWLHCYNDPLLAVLFNPMHANFSSPRLWRAEAEGDTLDDHDIKQGWTRMRLVEELDLPTVSSTQSVAFAILCAKSMCTNERWLKWAEDWLSGTNRSIESALVAWGAVDRDSAESAAAAAGAAEAAAAAAEAAAAAAEAAAAGAAASACWAWGESGLDLRALAQEAMTY